MDIGSSAVPRRAAAALAATPAAMVGQWEDWADQPRRSWSAGGAEEEREWWGAAAWSEAEQAAHDAALNGPTTDELLAQAPRDFGWNRDPSLAIRQRLYFHLAFRRGAFFVWGIFHSGDSELQKSARAIAIEKPGAVCAAGHF